MDPLVTYLINVAIYSFFPFAIASMRTHVRVAAFYVYIGILLLWGGLAGAVYSFSLFDTVQISGGNLTYGAFMMSTVMLIIIERRTTTFLNLIRLVVGIDSFVFVGFNFLSWILKNDLAMNQLQTPYAIFNVSLWVLVIGGVLILLEILFLLAIFIYLRNRITNVLLLSTIYTVAFIFILCFDGVLFPIFAIGLNADLIRIMFGNVLGKLTLALTFSIPLTVFFLVFRKSFVQFIQTPLILEDIVNFRKEELIDRIYKYELRQQVQEKEMEKLVDIAGKDPLTSLANRRKFESAFGAEWSRCQREKSCLTIVIGDVDYFKQYNDTYGHSQGDACLKTLAALWGTICERPFDVAARIGGEEFALILPNTSPEQILPRLEQFRDDLKRANIPHMASTIAPYVTMSIGAAGYIPKGKAHPMRMFDLADQRLYSAKQSGRNKIVIA